MEKVIVLFFVAFCFWPFSAKADESIKDGRLMLFDESMTEFASSYCRRTSPNFQGPFLGIEIVTKSQPVIEGTPEVKFIEAVCYYGPTPTITSNSVE